MRTPQPAPPAVKSSLSEQAFGTLEEMIVTLKLPPGSLWSEAMLSEAVGIGRTPVREAIQRLAEYHLVVIMPRHGVRIAEVNEQEQLLVLETRRELERLIATRAARRASAEEKQAMSAMAQALLAAGKAGDVVEMLRQYFLAKEFTARCAGNRFTEQAIAPLYTLSRRFYYMHHQELNDLSDVAGLHAGLLRAIATGDEAAAAAACERQIDYAATFAKRIITRGF
ncbi:MAG: GntR family transcriptional regulator [Burkholderiales bacterium]|nr:GntR family transcriptional regulator [Burkholderiales bacterium]